MFLAGTYDTSVRSSVKPKIGEWAQLYFPLRNNTGIAGLFFPSVPTTVMFLVKGKFASSQLVKKLSVVTPLPVSTHVTDRIFNNSKALLLLPYSTTLASVYLHVAGIKVLCISGNP